MAGKMNMDALGKCSATSADDTWSELKVGDPVKIITPAYRGTNKTDFVGCGGDVGCAGTVLSVGMATGNKRYLVVANGLSWYYDRDQLAKLPAQPEAPKPEPVGTRYIKVCDPQKQGDRVFLAANAYSTKEQTASDHIGEPSRIYALHDLPVDPATGVVLDAARLMEMGYEFTVVHSKPRKRWGLILHTLTSSQWLLERDDAESIIRAAADHYLANRK